MDNKELIGVEEEEVIDLTGNSQNDSEWDKEYIDYLGHSGYVCAPSLIKETIKTPGYAQEKSSILP